MTSQTTVFTRIVQFVGPRKRIPQCRHDARAASTVIAVPV